jgi:hypothetical protein
VVSGTSEQRKVNHSYAASLPPGVTPSKYIFFGTDESSLALLAVATVARKMYKRTGLRFPHSSAGIAAACGCLCVGYLQFHVVKKEVGLA